MKNDPIVDAVRKTREELAKAHDYNVQAIFASLRRGEAELGDRLVSQSPSEPSQPTIIPGVSKRSSNDGQSAPVVG